MCGILILLLPVTAMAAEVAYPVTGGNIYFDTETGTVTSLDYGVTKMNIPNKINDVVVKHIGERAFAYCGSLTSVTIPDSVTTIGDQAFDSCDNLFSVTIGDSVTTIGDRAFYECYGLNSVTIGNNVTTIGDNAFYYCYSLSTVTIPDSVTTIGDWAFYLCTKLNRAIIGDSVTMIGEGAFYCCRSLSSITMGDSVMIIGDSAFTYCENLSSITIPNSVTSIGDSAFSGCSNLSSVTISDSVTSIGDRAFCECASLSNVTIPDSVLSIGYSAFSGCSSLNNVTIGDSVTTIGDSAFWECVTLSSVTIPNSVTSIGAWAFYGCESMSSVTMCNSITSIGDYAFSDCKILKNIFYTGTEVQWDKVAIGNNSVGNANIKYLGAVISDETGTTIRFHEERYTGEVGQEIELFTTLKSGMYDCRELVTSLEWSSSDEDVFSIEDSEIDTIPFGTVTADAYCCAIPGKAGTAVVTVTTSDGASTSCVIEVKAVENSVAFDMDISGLYTYKQYTNHTLHAYVFYTDDGDRTVNWTWETDNPEVVSVMGKGNSCSSDSQPANLYGYYDVYTTIHAGNPGTATLTCTLEDGTTAESIEVTVVEGPKPGKPVVSSNHFNVAKWEYNETPEKKSRLALEEYIRQWEDAYKNYVETLETELSKEAKKHKGDRGDNIELQAEALKDVYEIAFPYMFPEEWEPYVYQVLCNLMMDSIEWNMDVDEIDFSDEIASEATLINQISRNISNLKHSACYEFDEVTIKVSGLGIYNMTVTPKHAKNGIRSYTIAYCQSKTKLRGMINDYVDALKDLEQKAIKNAYSETMNAVSSIQQLLGLNFGDDLDKFLEKKFKKFENMLEEKGLGDAYRVIVSCTDYYDYCMDLRSDIFSTASMDSLDESDIELLNNLLWIDESTKNKAVKKATKTLKEVSEELSDAYLEYLSDKQITSIEDKKSGWEKFWDNFWGVNCPVNVEIYNSSGDQVGYVGEDDIWYDDSIYIEENADAKRIYSSNADPISLKITGTDTGKFDLMLEEYQDGSPVGRLNFYDMSLYEGKSFSLTSSGDSLESVQETLVITNDEDGTISADTYIPVTANARVQIGTEVNDQSGGTVSGAGLYAEGDAVVLRASPNEGYRFIGWYDENQEIILSNSGIYEFTARKDTSLVAVFAEEYLSAELQISDAYCDKYSVEINQHKKDFTLCVSSLDGSEVTEKLIAMLASYTDDGQLISTDVLSSEETETGVEFYGIVTENNSRLFLLDEFFKPVIESYYASL